MKRGLTSNVLPETSNLLTYCHFLCPWASGRPRYGNQLMLGFSQTDSDSSMRGATSAINDQKRAENKTRETNRTYQALAVRRVTIFVHEVLTRDLHCL